MDEVKAMLISLHNVRARKEKEQAKYLELKRKFEDQNRTLIELLDSDVKQEEYLKAMIREVVGEQYAQDNEKKREWGITIRVERTFFYDPKEAFEWAKEHKVALQLDEKKFKDAIKSGIVPEEIAKIGEVPKVLIPTDVAKHIDIPGGIKDGQGIAPSQKQYFSEDGDTGSIIHGKDQMTELFAEPQVKKP
jgi:hypothetical protein